MLNHFTNIHKPSNMKIKAIEIVKQDLTKREAHWRAELGVAFPYGLKTTE